MVHRPGHPGSRRHRLANQPRGRAGGERADGGKSTFIHAVIAQLRGAPPEKFCVVNIGVGDLSQRALESPTQCFRELIDLTAKRYILELKERFGEEAGDVAEWLSSQLQQAPKRYGRNLAPLFGELLHRCLRREAASDRTLVLVLDRCERLLRQKEVSLPVARALRASRESSSTRGDPLSLFLGAAGTNLHTTGLDAVSELANVCHPIHLHGFTREELTRLADMYKVNWNEDELDELFRQFGGHPYFTRLILYLATKGGSTRMLLDDAACGFPHCGAKLKELWLTCELQPLLQAAICSLVNGQALSIEQKDRLVASGLVKVQAGVLKIVGTSIAEYFRERSKMPADKGLRFQSGGCVSPDNLYIERTTDEKLLTWLLDGISCHIVAPRQIGKSSLRARTTVALRKRGVYCASFDLTDLGSPETSEQWYYSLASVVAVQLDLPEPDVFWEQHSGLTPALRWREFLRSILTAEPDRRMVLFLDEIETVTLVDFPIDDFFSTLRGLSSLERLTICLVGVTSPNDLIKDKNRTGYNISQELKLEDFTRRELDALQPGFSGRDVDLSAMIDAIYGWTAGHPFLTMKLCAALLRVAELTRGHEEAVVDEAVREAFLINYLSDPNLSYAARRFDDTRFASRGVSLADKFELYHKVLVDGGVLLSHQTDVQIELVLCGMVKLVTGGPELRLVPRNRIFRTVFDEAWLRARGPRRRLSEAVWRWLDSGKDPSALLRGSFSPRPSRG